MSSTGYSPRSSPHFISPQEFEAEKVRRAYELSQETNRRRKLLADRKRELLIQEQERIKAVLTQRKDITRKGPTRYVPTRSATLGRREPLVQPFRAEIGPTRVSVVPNALEIGSETPAYASTADRSSTVRVVPSPSATVSHQTPSRSLNYGRSDRETRRRASSVGSLNSRRLNHEYSRYADSPLSIDATRPHPDTVLHQDMSASHMSLPMRYTPAVYKSRTYNPNDYRGTRTEETRSVHSTNNHIVMSKYGVLPVDTSGAYYSSQSTGSVRQQATQQRFAPESRPVEAESPEVVKLSDERAARVADVAQPVNLSQTFPFEDRARELQEQLGRLTMADRQSAATGRENAAQERNGSVDLPAGSREQTSTPLLSLRRRGSVTELRQSSATSTKINSGRRVGSGTASSTNSARTQIRGILKRAASMDNLLAGNARSSAAGDPLDVAHFDTDPSFQARFEVGGEESGNTKKSVRFAVSNSVATSPPTSVDEKHDSASEQKQRVGGGFNTDDSSGRSFFDVPVKVALNVFGSSKSPASDGLTSDGRLLRSKQQVPTIANPQDQNGNGSRRDSLNEILDQEARRMPVYIETEAFWATVRDYIHCSSVTPLRASQNSVSVSNAAVNPTGSRLQTTQSVTDKLNQPATVEDSMLELTNNGTANGNGNGNGYGYGYGYGYGFGPVPLARATRPPSVGVGTASTLQFNPYGQPQIWPSLTNPNVPQRRRTSATGRNELRRTGEDSMLVTRQVVVPKSSQRAASAAVPHSQQFLPA